MDGEEDLNGNYGSDGNYGLYGDYMVIMDHHEVDSEEDEEIWENNIKIYQAVVVAKQQHH